MVVYFTVKQKAIYGLLEWFFETVEDVEFQWSHLDIEYLKYQGVILWRPPSFSRRKMAWQDAFIFYLPQYFHSVSWGGT